MTTKNEAITALREDLNLVDYSDEVIGGWLGRVRNPTKTNKLVQAKLDEIARTIGRADQFLDSVENGGKEAKDDKDEEERLAEFDARVTKIGEEEGLTYEEAEDLIREEDELAEDDEDEPKISGIFPQHYKDEYKARGDSSCCGDEMSAWLKEATTSLNGKGKPQCDLALVEGVAVENGLGSKFSGYEISGLNPGMIRMKIGNLLRGMISREEQVSIDGEVVYEGPAEV